MKTLDLADKKAAKDKEVDALQKQISALRTTHKDLMGLPPTAIDEALDDMAKRHELRKKGENPGEASSPPSEGLVALRTLEMQREKLQKESGEIDERLKELGKTGAPLDAQ